MVSIIIPIHNVEKYIERCICSVIRQTYQDIECILVDDACEDSSMDICSNLLRMYDGPIEFKTIHLKKVKGHQVDAMQEQKSQKANISFI